MTNGRMGISEIIKRRENLDLLDELDSNDRQEDIADKLREIFEGLTSEEIDDAVERGKRLKEE